MSDDASHLFDLNATHVFWTFNQTTCNRFFFGKSTSHHRNLFHAWSRRCAGIQTGGNYSRCMTAEAVLAVVQLLMHPFGQYYSPIFIPPMSQYLTSVWTQGTASTLLQANSAPTWEWVSFSGMGGDCGDPLTVCPPWPKEDSRLLSPHWNGQTDHLSS